MMQFAPYAPAPSLAEQIAASPRLFPHALDPLTDQVLLVERNEADYRSAAFLDDRSLAPGTPRQVVPWTTLAAAAEGKTRQDAGYIFHIGHVGSTLVSRLLGEIPAVFALREPLLLRTFTEVMISEGTPDCPWAPDGFAPRTKVLRTMLSRTWRPDQVAIVKATSFTSELAPQLVPEGSHALLMFNSAARYLENILAGDESRRELHFMTGQRLRRLARHLADMPWRLWALNEPQRAALAWMCEMLSLERAEAALSTGASRWCDFDAFLAAPAPELQSIAAFFGHDVAADDCRRIISGPLLQRYSKGLEHQYSPALREQVLAQSRARNGVAIREALEWLAAAGKRYPEVAACLDRGA